MPKPVKQRFLLLDVHMSSMTFMESVQLLGMRKQPMKIWMTATLCVSFVSVVRLSVLPCTYLRTTHYCGLFVHLVCSCFTHYFCCLLLFSSFQYQMSGRLLYFLVVICASAQIVRSRSGPKATNVLYAADLSKVFCISKLKSDEWRSSVMNSLHAL